MFEKQTGLTADELAYEKIKKAIFNGYFKAGERLKEQELAEKLGISRTPVREALKKLENEGFLDKPPYRGVLVRKFGLKEAENIYKIRAVLEGLAASLLAESANENIISLLKDKLELAGDALKNHDFGSVAEINNEFHDILASSHDNEMLSEILINLRGRISIIWHSTWKVPGRFAQTQKEHEAIVEAISSGDIEKAKEAAVFHVNQSWEAANTIIGNGPFE